MYETQAEREEWAADRRAVFHGFAGDLELDLSAYDAAVADPATT